MIFMGMSFCVRGVLAATCARPLISCEASLTAPVMIFRLLSMPMMPAMAMPPMPMLLTYWKSCSGVAAAAVSGRSAELMSRSGNSRPVSGMMIHQTATEPQQMIRAYFSPTIYPIPRTAAPVLILNTSLVLSASACPHSTQRDVTASFHQPKVAMTKS